MIVGIKNKNGKIITVFFSYFLEILKQVGEREREGERERKEEKEREEREREIL